MIKRCLECNEKMPAVHGKTKRCPPCHKSFYREYFRMYMSKYNLKKRWENKEQRTQNDVVLLNGNYMTGLGTFILTKYRTNDLKKEYSDIKKLKRETGI